MMKGQALAWQFSVHVCHHHFHNGYDLSLYNSFDQLGSLQIKFRPSLTAVFPDIVVIMRLMFYFVADNESDSGYDPSLYNSFGQSGSLRIKSRPSLTAVFPDIVITDEQDQGEWSSVSCSASGTDKEGIWG